MKTPHWKVKKLAAANWRGQWLAYHPGCPPREHFCLRWLTGNPRCRILPTLPEAYQEAAERYRADVANDWAITAPPLPAPIDPHILAARTRRYYAAADDNHLHIWTRLWDAGEFYIGCTICRRPRY